MTTRALWRCWMLVVVAACGAEHRAPEVADATATDAVATDAPSTPDAEDDGAVVPDATTTPADASDDAVHCDHRAVVCRAAEPVCPEMQVASVIGTCWGPCVPIDHCVCTGPQDCPHEDTFACHLYRQRCGPYVH